MFKKIVFEHRPVPFKNFIVFYLKKKKQAANQLNKLNELKPCLPSNKILIRQTKGNHLSSFSE